MMDPYNLAICFGPTLLPIPEGKDQVLKKKLRFSSYIVNYPSQNLISISTSTMELATKSRSGAPTFRSLPTQYFVGIQ